MMRRLIAWLEGDGWVRLLLAFFGAYVGATVIGVALGFALVDVVVAILIPLLVVAPIAMWVIHRYLHAAYTHDGKRSVWLGLLRNTIRIKMIPVIGLTAIGLYRIYDVLLVPNAELDFPRPWGTVILASVLMTYVIIPMYWGVVLRRYERKLRAEFRKSDQDPAGTGMPSHERGFAQTLLEKEDQDVGDTRRELQAENKTAPPGGSSQ